MNMKLLFLVLLFLVGYTVSFSQDLIIANSGDSLKCKITKETEDKIYFTTKVYGEWRKVFLPKSQIKSVNKSFYKKVETIPDSVFKTKYAKFRFSVDFGGSRTFGQIQPQTSSILKSHLERLRYGTVFNISSGYFFTNAFGIGLDFSRNSCQDEVDGLAYSITGQSTVRYTKLSEKVKVDYFGPSIFLRGYTKNYKTQFITTYSMGILSYTNTIFFGSESTITGSSLGVVIGESVEYTLDRNILIGLGIRLTLGALTEARLTNSSSSTLLNLSKAPESMTRIEITAGLKINSLFK